MSEKLPYPTPHINAKPSDFGKTVLMPGDPLRSQYIAKNFIENPVLVNNVRGIQGYTGFYKGVKVSVMASGMGMPSMGIYSYELFNFFDVENILRIGSAGAFQDNIHVGDIVIGMGACTNSAFVNQYDLRGTFAPISSYKLLKTVVNRAENSGFTYHVGNLLSSDNFYTEDKEYSLRWRKMGVLATEMEAAALYMNAARCGKNALAMCTISDHMLADEPIMTAEERETTFNDMITLALDSAVELEA